MTRYEDSLARERWSPEVRQAAARVVVTVNKRNRKPTEQWLIDIAEGKELRDYRRRVTQ
ncbi:hypothetical protein AAFP30_10090 [Gordonia sp. CPCC 205515]|uniref:hypothetical protein n=1 Tax=Gordonia sp. CPCC 205515 TaxID=3140791 RepID=UPI003AF3385E